MDAYDKAEIAKSEALIAAYSAKILELQEQINALHKAGDYESPEHDVLCHMQGGLQDAMQKENDMLYGFAANYPDGQGLSES